MFGEFVMHGFEDPDTGQEHVALTMGDVVNAEKVLPCAFRMPHW